MILWGYRLSAAVWLRKLPGWLLVQPPLSATVSLLAKPRTLLSQPAKNELTLASVNLS